MWKRLLVMVVVVAAVAGAWWWWHLRATAPIGTTVSSTKLEIQIEGGFAFVAPTTGNKLEIAYLNDWVLRKDTNGNGVMDPTEPAVFDDLNNNGVRDANESDTCNVDQMGTHLIVDRGSVDTSLGATVVAGQPQDIDKAVIRFPALETANIPLTIDKGTTWPPAPATPGTPAAPANPDNEADWKDMVPTLRSYHGGTINPSWQTMVNGRMVLPGGNIKATIPSNSVFKKAHFEFKANNALKFKAAMTDRMIYTVDVPGPTVELQVTGATSGLTKLVLKPQGNRVVLILRGRHNMSVPGDQAPLKDFCSFYQLLQPMPDPKDFLTPVYIAATPATPPPPGSQKPSPGFFCNGDWF
jgi:hypothetical protein